ncbi:MAG: hypothetical protein HC849_14355 [Oscillatoriales cyanobacterium RU_3_3]|nr:hypothetical protein [Microcoleus sp. SU_5_6]NJL67743.1 hypothetical protein [Microcoleus sp. SM1_3_4]NJM61121.1 hypothetical protein [Oscillatoriales cyanobacterium RU_3_3]
MISLFCERSGRRQKGKRKKEEERRNREEGIGKRKEGESRRITNCQLSTVNLQPQMQSR